MSSKIKGLRRVGIVGLSTVVAASMMSFSAVSAQAAWATGGGEIGLVDTDTTTDPFGVLTPLTNGTQGATLVVPGVAGQALGSVRLLIPNKFIAGDTIDLTIFDRTATSTSAGAINGDTAHRLSFTSAPTVSVNTTPVLASTSIGPLSSSPLNTEGTVANGNAPVAASTVTGQATTPPAFTTTLQKSSRGAGVVPVATDIIRLTANNLSAGRDTDEWIVTVSGLKADLGVAVSPGELRVVPFAYDGTPGETGTTPSSLFNNTPDPVEVGTQVFNPVINLYTVPAYVAPVTFNIGAPSNIVADNTIQTVGDITITETNNASIQNGLYTVAIGSAVIRNTATTPVVVTTSNAATGESASTPAAVVGNTLQFSVAGAVDTQKLTIKLSGLLLSDNAKGPISYTLTGGSIGLYLFTPAGQSPAIGTVPADSAFGGGSGSVNQDDIVAPALTISAVSTPIAFRIGGIDRYQTAEKIALRNGNNDVVVLASGQDFPDALSSAYLAGQFGASIMLTKKTSLPASTVEGMRLLGTKTVYLIGGTGAISAGVEAQLRATSQYLGNGTVTNGQGKLQVIRLGGRDRYATNKIVNLRAAAVSTNATPVGRTSIKFGQASKLTALVATGFDFADALAGGPATAGTGNGGLPLILTRSTSLDPNALSQMSSLGIKQAVVLGGTGAVSASVATAIEGAGAAVYRIGGANRFETATMVADFEMAAVRPTTTVDGGLGFRGDHAYLARGDDFADALAGGPLAGGEEVPIVLTNPTTLSPATATWLTANAAGLKYVTALGLGGAVSSAVLDAANAAIAG